MTSANQKRAKRIAMEELRQIEAFLREWDPIEVIKAMVADGVASTEYAHFAPPIDTMLRKGCTVEELARYLSRCEREEMGLQPHPKRNTLLAHRILEWWYRWQQQPA